MNKDLFLAILAMDSYNHGYGQGINGLEVPAFDLSGNAINTVRLGNARITSDSSRLGGPPTARKDAAAGFYALAYTVTGVAGIADGSTVISYRGTDDNFGITVTVY